MRLFTTERRAPLRVLAGHLSDVNCAAFHPNGAYALSASTDATLRLWDISTPACIRLLVGHKAPVTAAAISADGVSAASASEDGTVKLWHLASGKAFATLPLGNDANPRSVCFSTSGRLLACVGERGVRIWEVRELRDIRGDAAAEPSLSSTSNVPLMSAGFMPAHQVLLAAGIEPGPHGQ